MIKIKNSILAIFTIFFIQSCTKILEPITFVNEYLDVKNAPQEEFSFRIESLNFQSAKKANKWPYPRKIIQTGSGGKSDVLNEANFLIPNLPKNPNKFDYQLGVKDELFFKLFHEYYNETPKWPTEISHKEYLIGVGDELTFIQLNENSGISVNLNDDGKIIDTNSKKEDSLIQTKGTVGSNGNILLLGMGNIKAVNRTLNDVQNEVRNILIRNGLAPNFQLEITAFNSKRAYFTSTDGKSKVIALNNLPLTLKEIGLTAGFTIATQNFSVITLTRGTKLFRFTAGQLLASNAPEIFIQNKDQIDIYTSKTEPITAVAIVGSKGKILLPIIGTINALNRTLNEIHEDIKNILLSKGLKPSFQIELATPNSKKAYVTTNNENGAVLTLSDKRVNLKEVLIASLNKSSSTSDEKLLIISLIRGKNTYRVTSEQIFKPNAPSIYIQNGDQIDIKILQYKKDQVFALSGLGNAKIVTITPSNRETLADILFTENGALSNLFAKRSEVYLLRGYSPSTAYHLDAQNVSRILVAQKTELRPNDIIFVADRPVISFARVLNEISPLRLLMRDIRNNNLP